MATQAYFSESRTSNPAIKPALITLLLTGTAGVYALMQTGNPVGPQASHDADAGSNTKTVANTPHDQANQSVASITPAFGPLAQSSPAQVQPPETSISESISRAANSAAANVQDAAASLHETVKVAISGAMPSDGQASAHILPAPRAHEPGPVQRIVLPDPVPSPAINPAPLEATQHAVPKAPALAENPVQNPVVGSARIDLPQLTLPEVAFGQKQASGMSDVRPGAAPVSTHKVAPVKPHFAGANAARSSGTIVAAGTVQVGESGTCERGGLLLDSAGQLDAPKGELAVDSAKLDDHSLVSQASRDAGRAPDAVSMAVSSGGRLIVDESCSRHSIVRSSVDKGQITLAQGVIDSDASASRNPR